MSDSDMMWKSETSATDGGCGGKSETSATKPSIPNLMKYLKFTVTKEYGESVWQKSYYDRILRNENEYNTKANYIMNNPANWMFDEYYSKS